MNRLRFFSYSLIIGISVLGSCSKEDPGPGFIPPTEQLTGVILDEFEGKSVVIYGNSRLQLFVAYSTTSMSGKTLNFKPTDNQFPVVFEDDEGTMWNIFGEAVSGPGDGDRLELIPYQVGFWFSFSSFFPKVTLYGEAQNERIIRDINDDKWLLNSDDIKQGAIKDGIPSINDPEFKLVDLFDENNDPYANDELMTIMNDNVGVRAYPHAILSWHEIVNDTFEGKNIVLSHCPLTGTSSVWESNVNGTQNLDFGVSGLLYNNNLILYDRNTESLWSQILGQSVFGEFLGSTVTYKNSIIMNWKGIKELGMPTRVLTENTGFTRNYNIYPYGDYITNPSLLYNTNYTDDRLHPKAWIMAIVINNNTKVYQFEDLVK
jgi:uncharacterized protein DUF3179